MEKLSADGINVAVEFRDGKFSVPGLDLSRFSGTPSEDGTAGKGGGPKFNIRMIEINNSTLSLRTDLGEFRIPFRLHAESESAGSPIRFSLALSVRDEKISVSGDYDLSEKKGRILLDIPSLRLAKFADIAKRIPGLELDGIIKLRSEIFLPSGGCAADIEVNDLDASYGGAALSNPGGKPVLVSFSSRAGEYALKFSDMEINSPLPCTVRADGADGIRLRFREGSAELEAFFKMLLSKEIPKTFGIASHLREDETVSVSISAACDKDRNWKLTVLPKAAHPLISLDADSPADGVSGELCPGPLTIRGEGTAAGGAAKLALLASGWMEKGGNRTAVPQSEIFGELRFGQGRPSVKGFAKFADASFEGPAMKVESVSGVLPFKWPFNSEKAVKVGRKKDEMGQVSVKGISKGDMRLGAFSGSLYQDGLSYMIAGRFESPFKDLAAEISGSAGFIPGRRGFSAELDFRATDPDKGRSMELGDLSPKFAGQELKGKVDFSGTYTYRYGRLRGKGDFKIKEGEFGVPAKSLVVKGLEADLNIEDLPAMNSLPGQKLSFSSLSLGNFAIDNGNVEFQLESPTTFFLEKADFSWCHGHAYTHAMRVHAGQPFESIVYCDRMNLSEFLRQFKIAQVKGDGTVSGRIPVSISKDAFVFTDGFLFSSPGVGGTIIFKSSDFLPIDESVTGQALGLAIAQQALKEFNYDWVSISLNNVEENLFFRMKMNGRPSSLLPFGFDIGKGLYKAEESQGPGADFKGILFELNLAFPFSRLLEYNRITQEFLHGKTQ